MLGSLSSRVTSIGGLSARVTPTNSDPINHCLKPHQAFQAPSPSLSEAPPFGEISPNHANMSHVSVMTSNSSDVKLSPNNVTKMNGQHGEVNPKVSPKVSSPSAFKNGPEVPRTIYPGLDDFLPECDGTPVEKQHMILHNWKRCFSLIYSHSGFLLVSDEVLSMDAAALEEDLAMLASPHNSGSWDSATLARAGQGKTLWIGEYHVGFRLD